MVSRTQAYLRDKYENQDSDRFKRESGEYHASQIATCERRLYWKFEYGTENDPSSYPYFLLGNLYEDIYGDVLRYLFEGQVEQDVEVEIRINDDIQIVGESDWVIFKQGKDHVDKVILENGERTAIIDGEEVPYDDNVQKVFETKTAKSVSSRKQYGPKDKHIYQVNVYMFAFDCEGEIVYVERNDLSEHTFEYRRDHKIEDDIVLRAMHHHENMGDEDIPVTNPLDTFNCKYCDFQDACKDFGGSVWS